MNEINLVTNKPTGYYAIPVNKNTFSFQPIQQVKSIINDINKKNQEFILLTNNNENNKKEVKRTITVNGTGELRLPPDQIKLYISITNSKKNIEEAKSSVQRRYEYVYQTLRKYKINESNILVNTSYNRKEDNSYEVKSELTCVLNDFKLYSQIYNILTEKLDKSVKILEPEFSHSSNRIESIKRQTTLQAIRNAKRTALDIANSVSLALGKPTEIIQEVYRESYADKVSISEQKTSTDLLNEKTITIYCNLKVTFDLLKAKRKEQDLE